MTEHIPAWKRIGLKVREELLEDPLAITPHIESSTVTAKQAKKLNKQKRKLEEAALAGDQASKKPPKRIKLPKSERRPPPEKDQLAYLRQYDEDKDNWKFSKQKQNWILKNIKNIPDKYENALQNYLSGLQGGSRDRLVESLKEVIDKWNVIAEEAERKVEEELRNDTEKTKEESQNSNTEDDGKKSKEEAEKEEAPDYNYALRCRTIIKLLTDKSYELKGIDLPSDGKEQQDDAELDNLQSDEKEQLDDAELGEISPVDSNNLNEIDDDTSNTEEKLNNDSDNLIIDEVEVSGILSEDIAKPEFKETKKSTKKSKSSKKKGKKH